MLTEGMIIAQRYEIIEKIGAGGMSDVYKAMDHLLSRNVAVKVLKNEFSEDTNFLAKFRTEAQAAAGLEHPNIVNIYDVGSENKMHYIVMEYVEGITLKTYIEKKERIGYKEAISIAIQTANGIRAAHNKNIIHRDIKPQNIIISTEGKVKVTDFGIARATTSNTINSDVMGSVHYTSPEQARNGYVDFKSDIYSLGIVMYEMVTGRVPFDGDTAVAVALQHLQEEIVRPSAYASDLPISLEKIILKCTQKSPDRRYANVDDLVVDLKKAHMNPDEDFVALDVMPLQENTRVISHGEVEQIKEASRAKEEIKENMVDDFLNEDDDDESPLLNPKFEKIVTILGIVAAIVLVVVVVLIIGTFLEWFHFGGKTEDKKDPTAVETEDGIVMIDLMGMTYEEAKTALNDMGLGITLVGTENSDEYEEGQIMFQSVEKGEKVEANTTIEVKTCAGSEGFVLVSVAGMTETEATSLLQGTHNLVVSVSYEYSTTVPAEQVISTSPAEGSTVHAGDTVTLIVSRGTEATVVPNVVGKTESAAKTELKNAGFSVTVNSAYSSSVAEGQVISQSVTGGKTAAPGANIKITVSLGPEANYSYSGSVTKAGDVEKGGSVYTVEYAIIEITVDGESVYYTETSSFPKSVSVTGAKSSSGIMTITWNYVNTEDEDDTYEEIESVTITLKQN